MARVLYGLDVSVGNRVLGADAHRPLTAAARVSVSSDCDTQEGSVPSSQLDMGAFALLLWSVTFFLLAIPQESMNVP